MAKTRTQFVCSECGGVQSRWMGRCPDCGVWDGLEAVAETAAARQERRLVASGAPSLTADGGGVAVATAIPLLEIEAAGGPRVQTGIGELDRVLGGGLVPGSVVLVGGDPGIGKSTLLLQAAAGLAATGQRVLYVSSEESASQVRLRAERLLDDGDFSGLLVLPEAHLARIMAQTRHAAPALLVVDSIQMVFDEDHDSSPGSATQLRRCCAELVGLAKSTGTAVIVVGHVTKDGQLAGPRLLEHLVDAVLSFEGDRHHAHRIVRAVKNRFGTTLETGLFEMTGTGLAEVSGLRVPDPGSAPPPGCVLCPVVLGSRCHLVEIQALTASGFPGNAKRKTSGLDASRLAMLIAVLEKHGGLRLADQDIFASSVGGLRVAEPAADLALCLAIAGAHRRRRLPPGVAVVGEVGLSGEVRHPTRLELRQREATRHGYQNIIMNGSMNGSGPGPGGPAPITLSAPTVAAALEMLEETVG